MKVDLAAVTRGEENRSWAEATPVAQFSMTIQNPDAAVQFRLGQEFLVTFKADGEPATLADGHAYVPSDYEAEHPDRNATHYRCQACGAKRSSHDEPVRSKLADWRP